MGTTICDLNRFMSIELIMNKFITILLLDYRLESEEEFEYQAVSPLEEWKADGVTTGS